MGQSRLYRSLSILKIRRAGMCDPNMVHRDSREWVIRSTIIRKCALTCFPVPTICAKVLAKLLKTRRGMNRAKKQLLTRIDRFVKVAEKSHVPSLLIGIKTTLMFPTSRIFSTWEFENSDGFCAFLICWAHRNSFSFIINIREAVNVRDINEMYSLMKLGHLPTACLH